MPTFPSYEGPPLPGMLKPLDPRHYLMLTDWIFFKPSRLKQYLYRADPDLFRRSDWRALAVALRHPAYRSLLLVSLVLTLIISTVVAWIASAAQVTEVEWRGLVLGVLFGVTINMALGVMWGVVWRVQWGVTGSVLWGVAVGMVLGVAFGVVWGVTGSLVSGLALGMAVSVAWGVAWDVPWGMAGVLVLGVAGAVVGGATGGKAGGVAWAVGALRIPLYIFQTWPAFWQTLRPGSLVRRLTRHPALGDELSVLPFPGLGGLLAAALAEDFSASLRAARYILRNPFQRWAVARGFAQFLAATPDPLAILYQALFEPLLDEYPVELQREADLRRWPPVRALWLGELAGLFVDATGGRDEIWERMAWGLTYSLRGRPYPGVAPLARFLLHLLDEVALAEKGLDRALLEEVATAVRGLPHGEEVALSLNALAWLVEVENLEGVAAGQDALAWLDDLAETPLRPQVLEALRGLGDVAAEVTRFRQATSPSTQAAALNRAVGMLNELRGYVEGINLPDRSLLRLVVRRWQALVAEAAGRLGERALREMAPSARRALVGSEWRATLWSRPAKPFPNPYKTGDPVHPPLFVGRGDVFNRIQEVWASKVNPDSIILYGHRRMGKSSILRNLGEYALPGSLLVYADLKGEAAFAKGTHHLLRGLADAVVWAAQERGLDVSEQDPASYAAPAEAALSFRRLLRRVLAMLAENASLVLALDEFEAVDVGVQDKKIGREIYDYLRSLSQEPRIVLIFAGLHTLDEMSRDYQAAFFDSYVNIRVSYLSPEAAERLIARPTPDFPLDYDQAVVKRIVHETYGQPLLVQRICQGLVNHVNHELFDLEQEREARVLPEDLEAVLSDDFIRSETRYFDGIWNDQIAGRAAVEAVLGVLASGPAAARDLARVTRLSAEEVADALGYLKTRDLVAADAVGRWDLLVPLMRWWLQLRIVEHS